MDLYESMLLSFGCDIHVSIVSLDRTLNMNMNMNKDMDMGMNMSKDMNMT